MKKNEKRSVTLYSIAASILMIAGKSAIGILTGSLAILTDALHSFLDMGASIITYFAVRISDRPADRDHHFGHTKVESLAALVQVLLLLATCVWIIREAVGRLQEPSLEINPNIWAYAVILGSIAIDISRVRALRRVAKKYGSQALEADALNFATDIFSSLVVIFGLVAVNLGLSWADPAAAIGVTIFILTAIGRMAKKSIDILLDRAPQAVEKTIRDRLFDFPEILRINRLRLRSDGQTIFADLIVDVDRSLTFAGASELKERIRQKLQKSLPRVDITLAFKPGSHESEEIADAVRYVVSSFGLSLHHLIINLEEEGYFVSMHIEMPGEITLNEAHDKVTAVTGKLHESIDDLKKVVIHSEPLEEECPVKDDTAITDIKAVASRVKEITESFLGVEDCHNIVLTPHSNGLALSADIRLDGRLSLERTNEASEEVEQKLKIEIKELVSVTLHLEPFK
jgi:cation diffusion facilitator family transporter